MFICCAIGSPDSCPAPLLLAGHSTCVLRWVGRGTRRSDRLPSLSLLLYFLVHHIAPSLVLFLLNPMWVFSSGQLTIWGVGWPLASPPRDLGLPQYLWRAASNFLIWCIVSMHCILCILCSIKDGCFARQYWRGGVENDFKYVTASFTLRDYFTESMSFAEKWCCPQLTDAWVVSSSPPSLF